MRFPVPLLDLSGPGHSFEDILSLSIKLLQIGAIIYINKNNGSTAFCGGYSVSSQCQQATVDWSVECCAWGDQSSDGAAITGGGATDGAILSLDSDVPLTAIRDTSETPQTGCVANSTFVNIYK